MGVANTIAKNSIFSFITTAFNTLAIFVVGILLARHFGAEQYGLYSFMMWLLSTAGLVVDLGMGEMTRRFVAEATGKQNLNMAKGIAQMALAVRGLAAILTALLIILLSSQLARLYHIPSNHTSFILIASAILPYTLVSILASVFNGFQKYEYSTIMELVSSLLRMVLIIILVFLGTGVEGVLSTYVALYALGFLVGLIILRRLMSVRHLLSPRLLESKIRKSAIKYSVAALGITGVDYFLWGQAEIMFLARYWPVEEVGFYSIAHKIPIMAISLIPFVFGRVLMPAVAEQFGKGDMEKIKRIFVTSARYLMILSLPIAAAGISLAKPIINVLFGAEYTPAIVIMQIAFIPFAVRGLTHAVSSIIYGIKEPSYILKIGVFLIVLSVGLNLWLIPKYGALGAVIATSVPRVISLPLYIRFVSRKIGASWPLGDTFKTVAAAVILGLVVFVIQYYLDGIPSLAVSIPVGIFVYVLALLALRVVNREDFTLFKGAQNIVPAPLRKTYIALLTTMQRVAR